MKHQLQHLQTVFPLNEHRPNSSIPFSSPLACHGSSQYSTHVPHPAHAKHRSPRHVSNPVISRRVKKPFVPNLEEEEATSQDLYNTTVCYTPYCDAPALTLISPRRSSSGT
jgi:hypothetical protein